MMAGSIDEKDNVPKDPIVQAYDYPHAPDEPVAEDEKQVRGENSAYEQEVLEVAEDHESVSEANKEKAGRLGRVKSSATDASATTVATSRHPERESKPWYKQPNPLRWGKIPPIPQERTVCREHKAGFFSLVYFQWVAPLMTVRSASISPRICCDPRLTCVRRRATSGTWTTTISGA